jgi:hypothetical protein
MRDLAVLDNGISPTASTGLLSPKQSPKTQTLNDNDMSFNNEQGKNT